MGLRGAECSLGSGDLRMRSHRGLERRAKVFGTARLGNCGTRLRMILVAQPTSDESPREEDEPEREQAGTEEQGIAAEEEREAHLKNDQPFAE